MAKYNFSITRGVEKFEVINCDSFEEAIAKVEKGLHDRDLQLLEQIKKEAAKNPAETPPTITAPPQSTLPSSPAARPYDSSATVVLTKNPPNA